MTNYLIEIQTSFVKIA